MKVARILVSLCFAFYSFIIFYSSTGLNELVYHVLMGKPTPQLAQLSQMFEPIGPFLLIFPVMILYASWRHSKSLRPTFHLVLTHLLFVGLGLLIFLSVSVLSAITPYGNGTPPISTLRIVGNSLMGVGILFAVAWPLKPRANTEQPGDGKPDPVSS